MTEPTTAAPELFLTSYCSVGLAYRNVDGLYITGELPNGQYMYEHPNLEPFPPPKIFPYPMERVPRDVEPVLIDITSIDQYNVQKGDRYKEKPRG